MLLSFLPSAVGMACAGAIYGAFDPLISGITVGFGAAVTGITVDYGIHLLFRIDNSADENRPGVGLAAPLLTAAATTVAAFLCLRFSVFPGLREMGTFAGLGVLLSALSALFVLPYLAPRPYPERRRWTLPLMGYATAFLAWRDRHRATMLATVAATVAVTAVGLGRVEFEGDMSKLNYLSAETHRDETRLLDVWGRLSSTTVVVRGGTLEEALQANDRLFAALLPLVEEGTLGSVHSLSPLLPSAETQRRNLARWNAYWSTERKSLLRARLDETMAALRFAPQAFEPFFSEIEGTPTPLTLDNLRESSFSRLLGSHIARDGSDTLILTRLALPNAADFGAVAARIREAVPGAAVADKRHFAEHVSRLVHADLCRLAFWAGLAVLACLLVLLGRIELALIAFLPVCLSIAVTLGILGIFGIPVNMLSSLFIVLALGEGVDFSIFLLLGALEKHRSGRDVEADAFGSVLICALTTVCGYGALACARHPAFFSTGMTGLFAIVSSLLVSVLVVPEVIRLLVPRGGTTAVPSAKHLAGGLWALAYLALAGWAYLFALRPVVRLCTRRNPQARARFARRYLHGLAVWLLRTFPYRGSERVFINATPEAFPKPCVIASNHQSSFDIMVCLALPVDLVMVVKRWVWKTPFMGRMLRDAGYILAGEDDAESVLSSCASMLASGVSVLVFPEGSRSKDGTIGRFHRGAFELAVRTGCQVVPVLLTGTRACLPRNAFWVGDHRAVIRVLPPVSPPAADGPMAAKAFADDVRSLLASNRARDWRLAQDGKPFWRNLRSQYGYLGNHVEYYVAWKLRLDPIYRHIENYVPETCRVLDIGCGYGIMANALAGRSMDRRVLGIDIDAERICLARRAARDRGNVEFRVGNAFEGPAEEADVVLLIDVLHYWPAERQLRLIAGACRNVRPGGTVVFRELMSRKGLGAVGERLAAALQLSPRYEGLNFQDRAFYEAAFAEQGMTILEEPRELATQSNVAWILGRAQWSVLASSGNSEMGGASADLR
jgi:1-acyl-sn-glycerol-3-phosphate acyltransferase